MQTIVNRVTRSSGEYSLVSSPANIANYPLPPSLRMNMLTPPGKCKRVWPVSEPNAIKRRQKNRACTKPDKEEEKNTLTCVNYQTIRFAISSKWEKHRWSESSGNSRYSETNLPFWANPVHRFPRLSSAFSPTASFSSLLSLYSLFVIPRLMPFSSWQPDFQTHSTYANVERVVSSYTVTNFVSRCSANHFSKIALVSLNVADTLHHFL